MANKLQFFGREEELKQLESIYHSKRSEFLVIYGRRRVGKSKLIEHFAKTKKHFYHFEGLEHGNTQEQINNFTRSLATQIKDPFLANMVFKNWHDVFYYITEKLVHKQEKTIVFFDEFQWMALKKTKLVSLLKYFWDNYWSKSKVMLILCGSIASFMVDKVINSSALYGRVNHEMLLGPLKPQEAVLMFAGKRSQEEILKYLMIFGAIPKYLEEINLSQSFNKNINRLCFKPNGYMFKEFSKIFFEQFGEAESYQRIVRLLATKVYTLNEISQKLKIASGGGLRKYLVNLENASMISSYISFGDKHNSKFRKYKLTDEFLIFYFKFIEPNIEIIEDQISDKLFENLCESEWTSWLGLAFERFAYRNSALIAKSMGFADEVIACAPYFAKTESKFQIDLIYQRSDKVICVCEVKYYNQVIETKIIREVENKCSKLPLAKGYSLEKALISVYGPSKSLEDAEYFDHYVSLGDLL